MPVGYLNITSNKGGKDLRTVAVDDERAPHITWAFQAYSSGQYSIAQITAELNVMFRHVVPTRFGESC